MQKAMVVLYQHSHYQKINIPHPFLSNLLSLTVLANYKTKGDNKHYQKREIISGTADKTNVKIAITLARHWLSQFDTELEQIAQIDLNVQNLVRILSSIGL